MRKTISDSQIEKVIEFTSFTNFKEKEEKILLKNSEDFFDSDMKFFRKGEIGDWQNHFTTELAERFDKEIDDKNLTININ